MELGLLRGNGSLEFGRGKFLCHQDQRDLLFDVVFNNSRLIAIRQHEIGAPNEGGGTVVLEANKERGYTNFVSK